MRYGVVFPQNEIGNDPAAIRDFAQAVEELGFDYLLAYDHVLGADPDRAGWRGQRRPYTYAEAFHEPLTLFSYLAGCTRTLELVTGVLVLPQRQAPLVAKQAAQVALLSGGRLRLGVGVGWNDAEYQGMGVDFSTRGRRIEAQIALLRRLWTEPLVTLDDGVHQLDRVGINPLPPHPIPIWMGGGAAPVVRRMARLADGWFMHDAAPEALAEQITRVRGQLRAEGRDPAAFGIDIRLNLRRVPEADWPDWAAKRRALGATHLTAAPEGWGARTPAAHLDGARRFLAAVGA